MLRLLFLMPNVPLAYKNGHLSNDTYQNRIFNIHMQQTVIHTYCSTDTHTNQVSIFLSNNSLQKKKEEV